MKSYIIIISICLSMFGTNMSQAQTIENINKTEQAIKSNGKYALMVMNAQHLKAGILTGKELKEKSSGIDFQIVTCGELVKEISQDKTLQNLIVDAVKHYGLKILACGLSIKQLGVDKSLLPAEMPVTANGLIYMLGLEEQGYKTIAF